MDSAVNGSCKRRKMPAYLRRTLALPCRHKMVWDKGNLLWQSVRMAQSQISRTLREEASVSRISSILARESFDSRSALGRRVCEEFSFTDALGRPQLAGCMKALGTLAERVPGIVLPPPKAPAVTGGPRLLDAGVPEPEGVPPHPARIEGLRIDPVAGPADRAVWNTLVAREHPHGMTTFAGRQVRYLVGSAHGWLGAAGFCAAALRVAARDRWIAWGRRGAEVASRPRRLPLPLPGPAVGALPAPGQPRAGAHPAPPAGRLRGALRLPPAPG